LAPCFANEREKKSNEKEAQEKEVVTMRTVETPRRHRSVLAWAVVIATSPAFLQAAPPARRGEQPSRGEFPVAVEQLLRETYLGHAEEYPDPGETYEVLAAFLARDESTYFAADGSVGPNSTLDLDISTWESLVNRNPDSRHAWAALAHLYEIKFEQTQDRSWLVLAVKAYDSAVQAGLRHGRIRYTAELADTLVTLGDVDKLYTAFVSVLGVNSRTDPGHYYLALVNYADALARLGQLDLAWNYFEQAIAANPKDCIFAVNLYVGHLLDHGMARRALEVIERIYDKQARQILVQPAFARRRALAALGLDTADADAEIAAIREFFSHGTVGGGIGGAPTPEGAKIVSSALTTQWSHNNPADDCRAVDYHTLFVDSATGAWFYSYTVNFAEVLYNEALSETRGAQGAVGWTVKDRALEALRGVWNSNGTWAGTSCDSYVGGWYSRSTCSSLPCNDMNNCDYSRWFCCVLHGGTTYPGACQSQFNDTHRDWPTLVNTSMVYIAYYVLNGWIPDITTNWAPLNAPPGSCSWGCNSPYPWCSYAGNSIDPSPNGPMEYLGLDPGGSYTAGVTFPPLSNCKFATGQVCASPSTPPDHPRDNYFWNRLDHLAVGWLSGVNTSSVFGCSADPDTPWLNNVVYVYVDGPPGIGVYLGSATANQYVSSGCSVSGQNYGVYRGFVFTIPTSYRTGHHWFYTYGSNTSNGAATANLAGSPLRSPW
jgi:tetratricopeptide (TPR) repeat protein